MPFIPNEGPYALIICPARELARQTYDGIMDMINGLEDMGEPRLRAFLCMGGIDVKEQVSVLRHTAII